MRKGKGRSCHLFLLLSIILMILPTFQVQAASKTTVYVVASIKYKGSSEDGKESFTQKISYNKNGLITKINTPNIASIKQTFTYGKKNRLKKLVKKTANGGLKGTATTTYSYKNGLLYTKKTVNIGGGTELFTYTWKNGVITSAEFLDGWKNDDGSVTSTKHDLTFTYKKGHVVKQTDKNEHGTNVAKVTLDNKGNVIKGAYYMNGEKNVEFVYSAGITYDKSTKRMKKAKTKFHRPMMRGTDNYTKTIKYKKIKVSKKNVELIKEQQWQLLNANLNQSGIGFAW